MVDEFKSIRDNLFKVIASLGGAGDADDADSYADGTADDTAGPRIIDARATRALLQALFARAGKSKDEVIQIVAREIGMAVAAMLKEPLSQLAKHQKLQISFEFVPKDKGAASGTTRSQRGTPTATTTRTTDDAGRGDSLHADRQDAPSRLRRKPKGRRRLPGERKLKGTATRIDDT